MSGQAERDQNAYEEMAKEAAERVPEFFEEGHEYSNNGGPYAAPETVNTFRCGWVGTHPETQEPIAFGFMHNTTVGWGGTGMGPTHWGWGWVDHGNWPEAGDGGGVSG